MRVAVTGAAGFIGSHLVDALLADGHTVLGIDDLSTGAETNVVHLAGSDCFELARASITDTDLAALFRRFRVDQVVHLAAAIDVSASVIDPVRDAFVNVVGTVRVLDAARVAGAHKFVFITSGGSIYGAARSWPATEDSPIAPESPYGASKAAAEIWLRTYRALHGLPWTALAPANVYGPRQRADGEGGVVSIFANRLLRHLPLTIFGDGSQTRDFVYVGDVAVAVCAAVARPGLDQRVNIGTGTETSVLDLQQRISAAVGDTAELEFVAARPGELHRSVLSAGRAAELLGWQPRTPLDAGLRTTVDWLRAANP